ncbi:MAG: hypothetical protein ABI596_11820 [Pyrinomonadaceae bacterium]
MATLTHEEFSRHLNTKFRIRLSESEAIESELTDVSDLLLSARQERFSLLFRGPNDKMLSQGMHAFEHDQMGPFELFIVPIERADDGIYYQAVFNRLIKK